MSHPNPSRDRSRRNLFVERVSFRMAEAAGVLSNASESLADRESMSLKDLGNLKWTVGRAVRSLEMVSAIAESFEADLLTPGGVMALAVAERRADRLEASILATVQAAIAGAEVRA